MKADEFVTRILAENSQLVEESFNQVTYGMQAQSFGRGWPIFGIVFVPDEQEAQLIPVWEALVSARCKMVELFLHNSAIRSIFGFTPAELELILRDPFLASGPLQSGKIEHLPLIAVTRLDGFVGQNFDNGYSNNEANSGPGGLDYHDVIGDLMWETPLGITLRRNFRLRRFTLRADLARTALRYFQFWNQKTGGDRSRQAVVLCPEIDREARLLTKSLRLYFPTEVATVDDPRWRLNQVGLYLGSIRVGVLLRTSGMTITHLSETPGAVTEALLTGKVLTIPTLCGRVGGNKVTDYFLTQRSGELDLSSFERRALLSIPATELVTPSSIQVALANQHQLILKPNLGGGGQDSPGGKGIKVTFGREVSASRWQELLNLAATDNTRRYLTQQVVPISKGEFVSVQANGQPEPHLIAWGLDPYLFAGKFGGYAARGVVDPSDNQPPKLNVGEGIAHSGCIYTVLS